MRVLLVGVVLVQIYTIQNIQMNIHIVIIAVKRWIGKNNKNPIFQANFQSLLDRIYVHFLAYQIL